MYACYRVGLVCKDVAIIICRHCIMVFDRRHTDRRHLLISQEGVGLAKIVL